MNRLIIEQFIWEYQRHFRISVNSTANTLFRSLDERLIPKVFLLGILEEEKSELHKICLEPEDCGYSQSLFSKIEDLANDFQTIDGEQKAQYSHPISHENSQNRIRTRSLIKAIQGVLEKANFPNPIEVFVSNPCIVEQYRVFAILELPKEIIQEYYSLFHNLMEGRIRIFRSLIESTAKVFLDACCEALKDTEKAFDVIPRSADELLREGGKTFMYTISQAGGNLDGLFCPPKRAQIAILSVPIHFSRLYRRYWGK